MEADGCWIPLQDGGNVEVKAMVAYAGKAGPGRVERMRPVRFGCVSGPRAFWALPAVALFVAHFVAGTPIWLGWAALGIWIVVEFAITAFLSWAVSHGDGNSAGTGTKGKATIRYSSQQHYDDE